MANAGLVAPQPLFPVPSHLPLGGVVLLGAAAVGIVTGGAAWLMTQFVYRAEDAFKTLTRHLHWMWWPMIGGLIIGVGGLINPRTLGVGYNTIHAELLGQLGVGAAVLLFVVKLVICQAALGSGTSGGILAPILIMGAALGGVLGSRPARSDARGVGAHRDGRSPRRSHTVPLHRHHFAFELTHDQKQPACPPRGGHRVPSGQRARAQAVDSDREGRPARLPRHAGVRRDPLEATFVREVMDTDVTRSSRPASSPTSTRP